MHPKTKPSFDVSDFLCCANKSIKVRFLLLSLIKNCILLATMSLVFDVNFFYSFRRQLYFQCLGLFVFRFQILTDVENSHFLT